MTISALNLMHSFAMEQEKTGEEPAPMPQPSSASCVYQCRLVTHKPEQEESQATTSCYFH